MTRRQWDEALAAIGLSQLALAQRLGRDRKTIYRWVNGHRPAPREVLILVALLRAGKISLDDLKIERGKP
jgi:transcriptional regulator with XRE-family HTH domain